MLRPREDSRLVLVLPYLPYHLQVKKVKIGIMFSIASCWTALFMLHHYVLIDLRGEDINRGELPDSRESTHACTQKHTDYVYIYKQGLAGRALPVEPVVCVAWKWERVIAAEVIAGIGILKGPNGCIYKNNNIETGKQKERKQRGAFHGEALTSLLPALLSVILSFSKTLLASMKY